MKLLGVPGEDLELGEALFGHFESARTVLYLTSTKEFYPTGTPLVCLIQLVLNYYHDN
jgi:hypothetical protein